ncbi:CBASS cGAMP-activated phospholipase [Shimia thalassica]|uniref:CBASS cGAMP-activated phospholipase n=1 Tax=Shimia thalassica TaxID=1715693 RepID=UPI002735D0DF|nr:CBASS cGAMP-activated phospholipase [Shimia thalassica]MDP2582096.1 CBASS cGAMP-activated phospholipase [Shimia thalassica]
MNQIKPRRSDGTIQQRRVKQPWPRDRPFKILSIDGGGIRGVFPAAYLAELENRFLCGSPITSHFDMVAGTSTGGIIALALAKGLTAQDALRIYLDKGERIFPPLAGADRLLRLVKSVSQPKHDQENLRSALEEELGDELFGAARIRCVIPCFEGLHGEPFIYKTPHHPDYTLDQHKRMVDIALQTSAAPTVFPAIQDDGYIMVDGGLFANNPIMNALVDAVACYDVPMENIRILSIGTGEGTFSLSERAQNGGLKDWAIALPFLAAFRAQSKNALGQAFLLAGKENVIRIDVPESAQQIELDDVTRAVQELPLTARSLVEGSGHYVKSVFLGGAGC